jgi:hypothetical protein
VDVDDVELDLALEDNEQPLDLSKGFVLKRPEEDS